MRGDNSQEKSRYTSPRWSGVIQAIQTSWGFRKIMLKRSKYFVDTEQIPLDTRTQASSASKGQSEASSGQEPLAHFPCRCQDSRQQCSRHIRSRNFIENGLENPANNSLV
jgi:hypothetical protein